jgi:hypothetical protein
MFANRTSRDLGRPTYRSNLEQQTQLSDRVWGEGDSLTTISR